MRIMEIKEALQICESLNNPKYQKPFQKMMECAIVYARIRVDWYFAEDEQVELDIERTAAHNAFIQTCDQLSLVMKENGDNTGWRFAIGSDRKSIGDFACLIHAIIGIKAR